MSDQHNVNSYFQSGGITAHTVNIASPARHMNEQIGQGIKQQIPTSTKVTVTAVMGDGEALQYAHEVFEWLKANGYKNVDGVNQAMYSNPIMGQVAVQREDGIELIIGTRKQ